MVQNKNFFSQLLHVFFIFGTYLFLYLPIVVLVIFSFNKAPISAVWTGFSLKWYYCLFHNAEILKALKVSLIVATMSTFLSVLLGTCFVVASKWWRKMALFNIFYANILLPEIILGIGILSTFTFFKVPVGYSSLIVGHTLLGLGFVVPIVRMRFSELDPVLTEASLDLGATYLQTFKNILIPLLGPALIASSLLVFTLSLDDFLISFFCSGPSEQTLSVYVYSMVKMGVNPIINAISTIFLAISSFLVLLLCALKVVDQVIFYE